MRNSKIVRLGPQGRPPAFASSLVARSTVERLGENCYFPVMTMRASTFFNQSRSTSDVFPRTRPIAMCRDWSVAEYVCSAGPGDRSFEERHATFTIAAVLEGTFRYKTNAGTSLMHPGAWLLGNHAECFSCGHDHSRGDRCISLHVSPQYFAEVSASRVGTSRFRFGSPILPAQTRGLSLLARAHSVAVHPESLELDEVVTAIVETVVSQVSGEQPIRQQVSARDEGRISRVLHRLEDGFAEVLNLDDLASQAAMSKYHFLRTFRRVVGRSPHRYLLDLRLQHVAHSLISSTDTITHIAVSCGFGDLSTFASHFKRQYGESPSRFRARHCRTTVS